MKKAIISVFILFLFASPAHSDLNIELLGILEGENEGDWFGYTIANLGDINGDGREDFAVCARDYPDRSGDGKVYIYLGSEGFDLNEDITMVGSDAVGLGQSMGSARDVNDDGYGDFLIGSHHFVYLLYGQPNPDTIPERIYPEEDYAYGWRLVSGDLNNDGYEDIVVNSDWTGHAWIYMGSAEMDTVADYVFTKDGNNYGSDGMNCGDINGDCYDDLLVSSGSLDSSYLYFGRESLESEPDIIFPHRGPYNDGTAFGDFNGDGSLDLTLNLGIWYGGSIFDTLMDVHFPFIPKSAGHFNRDRFGDLAAETGWPSPAGRVSIFLGASEMDTIPDWEVTGPSNSFFGTHLSTVDINGDGVDEFLVSAFAYPNQQYRGRVYVYAGDTTKIVGVEETQSELPLSFDLEQNYPNPFNLNTSITYSLFLRRPEMVTLKIYNLRGGLVRKLVDEKQVSGRHKVTWDGRNNLGEEVSSGIYFYVLKVGEETRVRKALMIK